MVGWMAVNHSDVQYIGLCGDRWQRQPIPWHDRVKLGQKPIGLEYLPMEGEPV